MTTNAPLSAGPTVKSQSNQPCTLEGVHETFRKWLSNGYDIDALDAVLATAMAHRLGGDPLWLMLVSGPGAAKTETVQVLAGMGAMVTSTIASEGALLSAVPKRNRTKEASGGLLSRIGDDGILVFKDFTTILSMDRHVRGAILAALREIHDGRWQRNVGTDGGRTLTWEGRLTVIGAVTTAWDSAYAVVGAMGDRFLLVRINSYENREQIGRQAIRNIGREKEMRNELAAAVAALFAEPAEVVGEVDEAEFLAIADFVTLARTTTDVDSRGNVLDAHAPEAPTRFAKQLAQLARGAMAIGLNYAEAERLAIRCARDSVPPVRLQLLQDIDAHPGTTLSSICGRLNKPKTTIERHLAALQLLGLVSAEKAKNTWGYKCGPRLNSKGLRLIARECG
jgi:DNA-binding transcriptional ArsR family regulator